MHRCHKCGSPVSNNDKFCGMCGTMLIHNSEKETLKIVKTQDCRSGIIYTDTRALATKFNVKRERIISILNDYIKKVSDSVNYHLLDACEHLQHETVIPLQTSNADKDWMEYHRVLYKNYIFNQRNVTNYLFIIGGEDIIPMPEIPNAFTIPDKFIPTDFLYAYNHIISKDTIEIVNSTSTKTICYYVGRLPLGTNATLDILEGYLNRSSKMMKEGIPVQMTYAQSDPTWKKVSSITISDISNGGLIPEVNVDSSLCYNNIFLSPYITVDTVDNVFNPYANLFYFNLHGSNNPQNPNFLGCDSSDEDRTFYDGISPKSFKTTKFDNIIVTEACYGGKFRGLKTEQSMLLTSLAHQTLIYLGSSVVALGSVDPKDDRVGVNMCCADVLAHAFIRNLIGGETAGEALMHTRYELYNAKNLSNLLTILEFSLFGDPAMTVKFPESIKEGEGKTTVPTTLAAKGNFERISVENVYTEEPKSFLSFVRQRVDDRFNQVHSDIQQYLAIYGVEPRRLATVKKFRRGRDAQVWYTYESDIYSTVIVVVDSDNNKTALFSKERTAADRFSAGRCVSINYMEIFKKMYRRFGLISPAAMKLGGGLYIYGFTTWEDNYEVEELALDSRIDEKSKLQVDTFNTMLDETYRIRMENYNMPGLTIKTPPQSPIDFAALMNPLCLILENELRLSVYEHLKHKKKPPKNKDGKLLEPTFGVMTNAISDNLDEMSKVGIGMDFVDKLKEFKQGRNDSAHFGNIDEKKFLIYYTLFASIVKDDTFEILMELKEKYK